MNYVAHLAAEEAVLHVEEEHLGSRGARIVEITGDVVSCQIVPFAVVHYVNFG